MNARTAIRPEVQVLDRYDVVVVGGGFAGVCAAVAASRAGARVTILERDGTLGGQAAGVIAAVAARGPSRLRELDVEVVQAELRRQGAVVS